MSNHVAGERNNQQWLFWETRKAAQICKTKERGEENYKKAENEVVGREKGRQKGMEETRGFVFFLNYTCSYNFHYHLPHTA